MQSAENKLNKNSLLLALRRYSSAVNDMEQTVLLPSLLRDVPSDEVWDSDVAESCEDLYGNYLRLKTIRNMVESGLVPLDEHKIKESPVLHQTMEPLLDTNPESLFCFHLRGLFTVMDTLTKRSQSVTGKYMEIIGVSN